MTANNSTQTSNPAQGTQPSTTAAAQATGSAASIPASVSTATHSSSSSATAEPASSAHSSHQTNQGIIDSANAIGVAQTSLLNLAQSLAGMFISISRNMAVCYVEVLIVKSHSFHRL